MNRRCFIKSILAAGTAASIPAGLLTACAGVKRTDLNDSDEGSGLGSGLEAEGATILRYASLAPSGHNCQPWTVRLDGPWSWTIGLDPVRRLPAVDPEDRELTLSIGAFVENLVLAAGALGFEAETEPVEESGPGTDRVRVRLSRSRPTGYPLRRLTQRRTVKKGFHPRELTAEDVRALSAPLSGHLHYFPRTSRHGGCIRDAAVEAFRAQSRRDEAQRELARWVRFSDEAVRRHRDGLTPEGMEIYGLAGWYVRHFMEPEDVTGETFRKQGVDMTAEIAGQGAGWLVVTSPGTATADLIETGRRFERVALLARERGLALHPMTQVLEEEDWRRRIARDHGPGMIPQFILRVGYLDRYPPPVSLRRPVAWFLMG
ncbi:MAG: hypothetical protein KKB20_22510 [Proteobacteria bacterium]|nr:hypothetical protein [Pseudomonadota bacterium]